LIETAKVCLLWQILLQKSPRREARCALAPNTSLDFELR